MTGTPGPSNAPGTTENTNATQQQAESSNSSGRRRKPTEELITLPSIVKRFMENDPDLSSADAKEYGKAQLEANMQYKVLRLAKPRSPVPDDNNDEDNSPDSGKIPKQVHRQVEHMPKLTMRNWHSWLIDLKYAVSSSQIISDILFGDVDNSHPRYNAALDKALVSLLRLASDRTGSNNISMYIDHRQDWGAREMLEYLRVELTKADEVAKSQVLMDLSRLRVIDHDIEKLIHDIHEIRHRGSLVGQEVSKAQVVVQLTNITKFSTYKSVWENLETNGQAHDYDKIVSALLARWQSYKQANLQRDRAALSSTASRGNATDKSRLTRQEAYWVGKKNGDKPAACYNCGLTGHIARACPTNPAADTKVTAKAASSSDQPANAAPPSGQQIQTSTAAQAQH